MACYERRCRCYNNYIHIKIHTTVKQFRMLLQRMFSRVSGIPLLPGVIRANLVTSGSVCLLDCTCAQRALLHVCSRRLCCGPMLCLNNILYHQCCAATSHICYFSR
uniref:Uncharacterized protein n=1 Tax=Rhipicephalus microplus TaxID=6941 RepID=A0A6G5AGB4_RHIMP